MRERHPPALTAYGAPGPAACFARACSMLIGGGREPEGPPGVEAPGGPSGGSSRPSLGGTMGPRRSVLLLSALLCALALCCAAPALALEPAGDGWYWASPQPQGNVLSAVAFGDALNAWSVGDGGTILHSSDAGVTWHLQASPATVPLGSVQFVGAAQGWAAGGDGWYSTIPSESANGVILHTSDGGATWAAQKTVPGSAISDLAFAGDRQGWAVGGRGLILHTADGGQTWTGQESGVTRNILSVAFADAQHGYAGCVGGLVLTTADGGQTWDRRAARSLEISDVISLAIGAEGKVWAAVGGRDWSGRFPRLYSSANGGRTWRYARVDFTYAVWDVVASDDDVYAVGPVDDPAGRMDVSRVLVSHDDGATWASRVTGAAQLAGIATTGAGDLCAVGDTTVTSVDDGPTGRPAVPAGSWSAVSTWSARPRRGAWADGRPACWRACSPGARARPRDATAPHLPTAHAGRRRSRRRASTSTPSTSPTLVTAGRSAPAD